MSNALNDELQDLGATMETPEGIESSPFSPATGIEAASTANAAIAAGPLAVGVRLEEATYEELAEAIKARLEKDRFKSTQQMEEVEVAEKSLRENQRLLEEMEHRILSISAQTDEVVELNVGGQLMSTSRAVLCSAEGSLLAGMFSGNFDSGHRRDKDGRIFLDVDPPLFSKLLSHLRLRRIASPECPAPLPLVPEEVKPEYEMLIRYFGLESFMYGDIGPSSNIMARIAELGGVCQSKLQSKELVRVVLSTTGGVPGLNHEEVFGQTGFHERSLENSYGAQPNTITVKFLKHRVRVEGMELRAKQADVQSHMSNSWTFRQGSEAPMHMSYPFSRYELSTGRLPVSGSGVNTFVDEIVWSFPRDFCLERIVLFGRVMTKRVP